MQKFKNINNRHCELKGQMKGQSEAISLITQIGFIIIRLLHSFAQACLKVRNDVVDEVRNDELNLRALGVLLFLTITISTQGTIITVKQDGTGNYLNIQEAIDTSVHGDTVLVYPGTYYENVLFNSKKITLASLYLLTLDDTFIHNTIIDGHQNGSCVRIIQGEDETTVLCGFTLQNGSGTWYGSYALYGGGIYVIATNPQIKNCHIKNNTAWAGGGIMVWQSNTFLSGCHIVYNYARNAGGGIQFKEDSFIEFDSINRNNIYLNHAPHGADINKGYFSPALDIYVDTFTVINPDFHFAHSNDNLGFPVDDINFYIENAKIDPVDADLYVSPAGNDSNSGLTPDEPLKTIWYAYKKICPDSINPNTIYLLPGTYSSSTNAELFPMSARSYVSLIGDSCQNTILDAELYTYHLNSNNLTRNYSCINLSFINGNEMDGSQKGSVFLNYNVKIYFKNVHITNCTAGGVFSSLHSDSLHVIGLKLSNIYGVGISIGNSFEPKKSFLVKNSLIEKIEPALLSNVMEGGLGISIGSSYLGNYFDGKIINTQINDNNAKYDPIWGNGFSAAMNVSRHVNLDLVNTTIGNNVVEDDFAGAAVRVDEGSVLNIYNSIFYGDSIYELTLGSSSGSDYPATANISYSNLEGGEAEIQNWYNQHTINWLEGNINANPQWIETEDSLYQLKWNSPCIDAGVPMYEPGMDFPYIKIEDEKIVLYKIDGDTLHIPSTDLAGNPRIVNNRIDLGAYEYQDTSTRVKKLYLQNLQETKINVYPNPFREHAFISFKLEEKAKVRVIIYNIAGNQIKQLMDATLPTGEYSLTWEGDNDWGKFVNPGTYLVSAYINDQLAASTKIIKRQRNF